MTQEIVPMAPDMAIRGVSPSDFERSINEAQAKAQTLARIVESQKLYANIQGNKYLTVEAWQTIGSGYGLTAAVPDTELIKEGDVIIGARARAVIYDQDGAIRGGAYGYCFRDESRWARAPVHQMMSMAGTRAVSKAFRLLLSWVVVLAGYEPTGADEVVPEASEKPAQRSRSQTKAEQPETPAKPSTASLEALRSFNQLREAYNISVDQVAAWVSEYYEGKGLRDLTDDEIDFIKSAIQNGGTFTADLKPQDDAAQQEEQGELLP